MITFLAVAVAAVYAWFTYGLWGATQAQTRLNWDTFVSEHRPYVTVRFDTLPAYLANPLDIRTATNYRVHLKNSGKSPANVLACSIDAKYQGQLLGSFTLGTAAMGILPDQEQMINTLLPLSGNALGRHNPPDPVVLEVRVDYTMDTSPAPSFRFVTAAIIEMTLAGQFLTHQVLATEPIPEGS